MRSLPASSTLAAILRILSGFDKILILSQFRKALLLAHCQKGFLMKNSLENFSSKNLFHPIRKPFSSDQTTFLRTRTSVFDRFIAILWMKQRPFASFCPRFPL